MANTYTQIHIQCVVAVKYRLALIDQKWKERLHQYITAIVQDAARPIDFRFNAHCQGRIIRMVEPKSIHAIHFQMAGRVWSILL